LPRDNFRRERERRIRSAFEFDNLYWKIVCRNPLPPRHVGRCGEMKSGWPVEVFSQKTFYCINCGQVIIATSEDRVRRAKISCPKCNQKYKLHVPYATHEVETIQYEK